MPRTSASEAVCAPLESVPPPAGMKDANPAVMMAWQRAIILSVASASGPLLFVLRRFKKDLAQIMRFIKTWCDTLLERARSVLCAVCRCCAPGAAANPEDNAKCLRYLMMTAQHDDAMQECPANGMASL